MGRPFFNFYPEDEWICAIFTLFLYWILMRHTHTHPRSWGTAAGLGQQSTGSFVLIILRLQLDSSQPDLFTVWVSLERKIKKKRNRDRA